MNGVRICVRGVVEYEVRSEELMVGDLVSGGVVAGESKLEEKAAEASTWEEDGRLGTGWETQIFEVGQYQVEDRLYLSFKAFSGPVAVELADGGVSLEMVVGFGCVMPGLGATGRLLGLDAHR